jgi:tetratricopeptide (TPR) repeat protein
MPASGGRKPPGVFALPGGLRPPLALAFAGLLLATEAGRAAEPVVVYGLPPQSPAWLDGYRIRWPLRVTGDPAKQTAKTIIASLPTGGWLRPDASDVVVQTAAGQVVPVKVLSHDQAGETIIQFKRHGDDPWYWAYGVSAKPLPQLKINPAHPDPDLWEGLTVEVREWAGDDLSSWARVRAGLNKSDNVIGSALVAEVIQSANPVRPDESRRFAASYRGFLNIKKEGVYRFFVNSDDAAFLFIDGFRVCERVGANQFLTGTVKLKDLGTNVNLKVVVHPFEVHHVVGDNRSDRGRCTLHWMPPGQAKYSYVPHTEFVQAVPARVAALEKAKGAPAAAFAFGNDDLLNTGTVKVYLVRFAAQGEAKGAGKLEWDFGDGTTGAGRSPTHVYFKSGDYLVTLKSAKGLPAFRRRVHVWPAPGETSPLSLGLAVKHLKAMPWQKMDLRRVRQMFAFLVVCEQPERWPLLEKVARFLLTQKGLDLQYRAQLSAALIEALANTGRAAEALKLAEKILPEFARVPSLKIQIQLTAGAVYQYQLKEPAKASKLYQAILDDNRRLEHPTLRQAAVRWGDLYTEAGDYARANRAYRLATTLGGAKFNTTASTDAVTRGALMRIAEQKLRAGSIAQSRQLLERLELEHPGRKLDGLYCFLRGEADRFAGRYEEALRNYEVLLKLPQWAGYRDRALFGIADSYYRMGRLEKALEWLEAIQKTFPSYYTKEKLADFQKLVRDRQARIEAARKEGRLASAFFKGYSTGFEPDEPEPFGQPLYFSIVRAPGMQGPHVGFLEAWPNFAADQYRYYRPLKNLTGQGTYWIELWYRVTLGVYNPLSTPHAHAWIGPATGDPVFTPTTTAVHFDLRTFGQWRKIGFKVKAPLAQDGRLLLMFRNIHGLMEIDALSIRPVSDRQNDSLLSFNEGSEAS